MKKLLEVGDTVWTEKYHYGELTSITFSQVVRLTRTTAVLGNGYAVFNTEDKVFKRRDRSEGFAYNTKGNNIQWYTMDNVIVERANRFKIEINARNWFATHKFTTDEKVKIYNLLNPELI